MSNMAHYPNNNPGAARFIGGAIMFIVLTGCMAVYLISLAWGCAP